MSENTNVATTVDFDKVEQLEVPPIIIQSRPEYAFRWAHKRKIGRWRQRYWEVHHLSDEEKKDLAYWFDNVASGHPVSDTLELDDCILMRIPKDIHEKWVAHLDKKREDSKKGYAKNEKRALQRGISPNDSTESDTSAGVEVEDVTMKARRGRPPK